MPAPNRSTTHRGFITYDEFNDSYGAEVVVRESSAALAPHVWVFIEGGCTEPQDGSEKNHGAAHLTVEQATQVRDALNEFISAAECLR
jgi:hypothetical protein